MVSRLTFTADNSRAFWTPDGKAIVFASQRNDTDHVFLATGRRKRRGGAAHDRRARSFLFESRFVDAVFGSESFDVTADGERFVVVESKSQARAELHVILNWFEELERLVPTN